MKWSVTGIGIILLAIGLYFFPFGEDILFEFLLDSANGDYWLARTYQYFLFGSMIFIGFLLLKYKSAIRAFVPNPMIVLAFLFVIGIIIGVM